jgi:hypothetical protein
MSETDQDGLRRQMRALADRAEIGDLISSLGLMLDEKAFERISTIFTEDVVAEFPFGRVTSPGALAEQGRKSQGRYAGAQHVFSNQLVDLKGDSADARANLVAIHVHRAGEPGSHHDAGFHYRFKVARTAAGWRISHMNVSAIWVADSVERK